MKRAVLLFGLLFAAPVAALEVDLELVLAVDVSRSVDDVEAQLQRQGYIAALTSDKVVRAIQSGAHGAIAITYVEWASATSQSQVIPWTLIRDDGDAEDFAAKIASLPRLSLNWTSVSGAIDFSAKLFDDNGFEGVRRVIDVSGDGRNNSGRPADAARDEAVAKGITINGLPIMNDRDNFGRPPERDLDDWYEQNVIGGPGAFMIVAENFVAFGSAVLSKLIREIAGLDGPYRTQVAGP